MARQQILAFFVIMLCTESSSAHRFKDNPDVTVNRFIETQFMPIGELESIRVVKDSNGNDSHDYGTGFLVSPCLILTNAHVAFGDDGSPRLGKDYSFKFRAGVSGTSAFAGNTIAKPVLWGLQNLYGRNDWALMKLTACIGAKTDIGWYETSTNSIDYHIDEQVLVAGYPSDKALGQLAASYGQVKDIDKRNGFFRFSSSMVPGQSGAPVFRKEDGRIVVIGINSMELLLPSNLKRGETYDTYSDNIASEFQCICDILKRSDVKDLIQSDITAFGQPNPAALRLNRPLWPLATDAR